MTTDLDNLVERFQKARQKKQIGESHWKECYEYAFPQRESACSFNTSNTEGTKKNINLFDGTAPDAVEQLASSMLAELTPPWAKWFGFKAGSELTAEEKEHIAPTLEQTAEVMLQNFEHSNLAVEIHQCYLDLVTAGTASLLFEEAPIGEATAFQFYAVPLKEIALEEGANGKIDTTFRCSSITLDGINHRFPDADIPQDIIKKLEDKSDETLRLIEAVIPKRPSGGYEYTAFIWSDDSSNKNFVLKQGVFDTSSFINFRWLKAPGETYGRSPVMKALSDIKTVNKVVELILKNASISVTGIWQAEDDGILNPANIKLVPGAIIPKAIGSKGLTPLEAPGNFDVSEIVLSDLRSRINHALLADRLSQIKAPQMTATEVLERAEEMVRILGATFGRLQSELLTPLIKRALGILRRRGEIKNFDLDGKVVDLQYRSPLALLQARKDVGNISEWVSLVSSLGPDASRAINFFEATKWLGKTLNVPTYLINEHQEQPMEEINDLTNL